MINPTNNTKIQLTYPFKDINKKLVIKNVLKYCNLPNIVENHSSEGGFELPLTSIWFNANLINKELLDYHNARQIRFYTDNNNNIIGLRLKDGINYMTDEELIIIKECVDNAVKSLNII